MPGHVGTDDPAGPPDDTEMTVLRAMRVALDAIDKVAADYVDGETAKDRCRAAVTDAFLKEAGA